MCDLEGELPSVDSSSYRSNLTSPEEWAAIWLRYNSEKRNEDFWAWDELTWTVADAPERAWPVILELVRQATDEQLGAIGAGPIEHLVENHVAAFVDRIEAQVFRDPRFQDALAAIWLNTWNQEPSLITRIVAASGGQIEPFYLDHDRAEREGQVPKDGA